MSVLAKNDDSVGNQREQAKVNDQKWQWEVDGLFIARSLRALSSNLPINLRFLVIVLSHQGPVLHIIPAC